MKRGTVYLEPHQSEWERSAEETIRTLKNILGSVAVDIQHIGSTSIKTISAKPIIDIAVAVNDYEPILRKRIIFTWCFTALMNGITTSISVII